MKKIILFLIIIFYTMLGGCALNSESTTEQQSRYKELELENEFLKNKINMLTLDYNKLIQSLERNNEDFIQLKNDFDDYDPLEMIRFSALSRLQFDQFKDLENIYKINSIYTVKDDWYIINENLFEIELIGYESAVQVDFFIIRLESEGDPSKLFTDVNAEDGWIYKEENIDKIIDKHRKGFEPYFILYTEVTFENGEVERTSLLPIYNKWQ